MTAFQRLDALIPFLTIATCQAEPSFRLISAYERDFMRKAATRIRDFFLFLWLTSAQFLPASFPVHSRACITSLILSASPLAQISSYIRSTPLNDTSIWVEVVPLSVLWYVDHQKVYECNRCRVRGRTRDSLDPTLAISGPLRPHYVH